MGYESKYPKKMEFHFNEIADRYDIHMANTVTSFNDFYKKIPEPINAANNNIELLDLGIGTGIELQYLFKKNPLRSILSVLTYQKKCYQNLRKNI